MNSTETYDPLRAALGTSAPSPGPSLADLAAALPDLEVLGVLGRGGMGLVYRVRRRSDGATLALKVVQAVSGQEGPFLARFAREAEALTRLDHPNIAAIHAHGEMATWGWLLMELIDGATLRDVLATGRLSPAQALTLVTPLCNALQYAHDHGVVHRDLKPENIILDGGGNPHVVDFGLAKIRDPASGSGLTNTGTIMGTMHYMAPEQIENAKAVDHRADIYALGVVIYELLTGQLPLGRFEVPSHRAAVDERIDEVVLKALERDPQRRWQQARAFSQAMAAAGSPDSPPVSVSARWSPVAMIACATLMVGECVGAILLACGIGGDGLLALLLVGGVGIIGMVIAHANPQMTRYLIGGSVSAAIGGLLLLAGSGGGGISLVTISVVLVCFFVFGVFLAYVGLIARIIIIVCVVLVMIVLFISGARQDVLDVEQAVSMETVQVCPHLMVSAAQR